MGEAQKDFITTQNLKRRRCPPSFDYLLPKPAGVPRSSLQRAVQGAQSACVAWAAGPRGEVSATLYLVRRTRRHRTRRSRAAATARPQGLSSLCSNGSSGKRPMLSDTSSAVRVARDRGELFGSLSAWRGRRLCRLARFPLCALSGLSGWPVQGAARMSPGTSGGWVSKFPDSPPPAQLPPTRTAPLGDASLRAAPRKRGGKKGRRKGKGWDFPRVSLRRPRGGGFVF